MTPTGPSSTAEDRLAAVKELHSPSSTSGYSPFADCRNDECRSYGEGVTWPCETAEVAYTPDEIQAVKDAMRAAYEARLAEGQAKKDAAAEQAAVQAMQWVAPQEGWYDFGDGHARYMRKGEALGVRLAASPAPKGSQR